MELDINPSSQQVSPISFTTPPRVFHDDLEGSSSSSLFLLFIFLFILFYVFYLLTFISFTEQPEVAARGDKCPGPRTSFVEKRMVRTNGMFKKERREERGVSGGVGESLINYDQCRVRVTNVGQLQDNIDSRL